MTTLFNRITLFFALLFTTITACAWQHGISMGFGGGEDINHTSDHNTGAFVSGEFLPLKQKHWMNITLNGSIGKFHVDTPNNNYLATAAASVAFRFYGLQTTKIHPFLLASAGPAYLSCRKFGQNTQAANFAFQSILGAGFEIGETNRVDVNMRFVHYSNAYTMKPNEGFNIFYIASVGYLFS